MPCSTPVNRLERNIRSRSRIHFYNNPWQLCFSKLISFVVYSEFDSSRFEIVRNWLLLRLPFLSFRVHLCRCRFHVGWLAMLQKVRFCVTNENWSKHMYLPYGMQCLTILAAHIDTSTNRISFNVTSCPKQGVILDTYKKSNNIAIQMTIHNI